jgi:3-methyl-2-oxobutanoate hydroxymethyltransferase
MKKFSILDINKKIEQKEKISFITAYDFPTSHYAMQAGIELILVGDSGGMCLLGKNTTLEVTMNEMLIMTEAVSKANRSSLIIADMPFMSYQVSNEEAVSNAGRFMTFNIGGVKLEGGERMSERVKSIVDAGIPVMGHLGLTPQSIAQMGGYKIQGKSIESINRLLADIDALIEAGVFSILLEAIPNEITKLITDKYDLPFFGIGAGIHTDGQLVISNDMLGNFVGDIDPKFVRKYANISDIVIDSFTKYKNDIKNLDFPSEENFYTIDQETLTEIEKYFKK